MLYTSERLGWAASSKVDPNAKPELPAAIIIFAVAWDYLMYLCSS